MKRTTTCEFFLQIFKHCNLTDYWINENCMYCVFSCTTYDNAGIFLKCMLLSWRAQNVQHSEFFSFPPQSPLRSSSSATCSTTSRTDAIRHNATTCNCGTSWYATSTCTATYTINGDRSILLCSNNKYNKLQDQWHLQ